MNNFFDSFNKSIKPIVKAIISLEGIPYLVGGTVRDLVLKKDVKDIDIEVHKLSLERLQSILRQFGIVRLVGKQFGVLRIDGINIDWSLPRKDSIGRKPEVEIDPNLTIEKALRRRDLTMNAMAINLKDVLDIESIDEKLIIDPYNGLQDIKKKQLCLVDKELFLEDPLRFFRVMQFISRFEMLPDKELNDICKSMSLIDLVSGKKISRERIFEELKKLFLKSKRPSLGFRWLNEISRLKDIFPELYSLINVKQKEKYHPEGDVFEHTMQSVDAAANINLYENDNEKLIILLAALCHDLGKPQTTDKNLSAKGHEEIGAKIARTFLKRLTDNNLLMSTVYKLVYYHMAPTNFISGNAKLKAYKRLAKKLYPQTNLRQLALVALVDKRGRNPQKGEPLKDLSIKTFEDFIKIIEKAKIDKGPEPAILQGRDLLDALEPGPKMGKILKKAYEIQIEEGIKDKEVLKQRVLDK
jgi:tRNA nucleotidyltransferase (CCA-adding enzyme)